MFINCANGANWTCPHGAVRCSSWKSELDTFFNSLIWRYSWFLIMVSSQFLVSSKKVKEKRNNKWKSSVNIFQWIRHLGLIVYRHIYVLKVLFVRKVMTLWDWGAGRPPSRSVWRVRNESKKTTFLKNITNSSQHCLPSSFPVHAGIWSLGGRI